jgi:DNA-binding GntR family transcriptional regulator
MRARERVSASSRNERVSLPRRQNLADNVYEALKELIMDGIFPQGSRVNLDKAARQLQVSQSPLREALVRLESEGLVIKEPFRGYSTAPVLSKRELQDLFEFRFVVEPWAAARITDEGAGLLAAEMSTFSEAPSGTSYHDYRGMALHDARLHDLVQKLAGNGHMRRAFQRTHCHLHILRLYYQGGMGSAALREHRLVVDAIASGDPDAAAAAMRAHLEASRERLLPVFTGERQVAEDD